MWRFGSKAVRSGLILIGVITSLVGCGGGGSDTTSPPPPKVNQAPHLTVALTAIELEAEGTYTLALTASDDDGPPLISIGSKTGTIETTLAADQKSVHIKAGAVTAKEVASFSIIATERSAQQRTASSTVTITLYPKLAIFAQIDGVLSSPGLKVTYGSPVKFFVVNEFNEVIPFTQFSVVDPSVAELKQVDGALIISAKKTGTTDLQIAGTLANGHSYKKTLPVSATGNSAPAIAISQQQVTVQTSGKAELNLEIADIDGSVFINGSISVTSSNPALASVQLVDRVITVTGHQKGQVTITASAQDGEFLVRATVNANVIDEVPPTIVVNQGQLIEMEELSTLTVPIDLIGTNTTSYVLSVTIEDHAGDLDVVSHSLNGRMLTITTKELPRLGNSDRMLYDVNVSATNGQQSVKAPTSRLEVMTKLNGAPIFELSPVSGPFVLVNKTGKSTVKITVNDDNPNNVTLFTPEAWFNKSETGSYQVIYDDSTRELSLDLTGFEKNQTFGITLSYRDGQLGGKFSIEFRTVELTDLDREMLEVRKVAIAKTESVRAYQLLARFYAEYLENQGIVDAQFVDELNDQMQIDDSENQVFNTTEYYIAMLLEQIYTDEFNLNPDVALSMKLHLSELPERAGTLSITKLADINALALLSKGALPELSFETTSNPITDLHYSKFYGNSKYGAYQQGQWVYFSQYHFLAAIDAKVAENTLNRISTTK